MSGSGRFSFREIAVPAYGPTIVAAVGTGAVTPIIALGALDLGASVSVAALAVGLGLVAELFFAVPVGSLIERVGERRALAWAALVDAVASAVAWLAPGLTGYFVALFALGFTNCVFLIARQGYLIEAVPYAARARAMSTLGGVNRIGIFLGPFIAAPLVHLWGPRTGYAVAVVAGVAAGVLVLATRDLTAAHERAARAARRRSSREVLWSHRRTLLTVGIGVLFIGIARAGKNTIVPLWAEHVGLTASQTALVFGVAGGIEMLLFYPAGSVMDRFGRLWVALPMVAIIGTAMVLLPRTTSLLGVALVAVIASLGNGLGSGIVMTLGADAAPSEGRAQFLGGWRFLSVAGGSLAPVLISVVAATVSLAAASVALGVIAWGGGLWLVRFLRPRDGRSAGPADRAA